MRQYYASTIKEFLVKTTDEIIGVVAKNYEFSVDLPTMGALKEQIRVLQGIPENLQEGYICFEYSIPRMGKRVDTILLIGGLIIVLEFKVGETTYPASAIDQVLDYALDLKYFQEQSWHRPIVPILVATEAHAKASEISAYDDNVFKPIKANKANLFATIRKVLDTRQAPEFDPVAWINSNYKPTPTIIEAAQVLYQSHSVKEITRADAGAENLTWTADAIYEIIQTAKRTQQKSICFVTGVPGAGKTLAGLNIATQMKDAKAGERAVFLSGNGPLVLVLREALIRDKVRRSTVQSGKKITRSEATREVRAFIQNIYHYRDDALQTQNPPDEKIAIFDEAQRAWTRKQLAAFMKKRNTPNFPMSEPEFLISYLDRCPNWAVIICLVGGGQEINTGEAGLIEWFRALKKRYQGWHVYVSPNITTEEYTQGENLEEYVKDGLFQKDDRLHLAVSIRSFRAETVSDFVKAVLDNDLGASQEFYRDIHQYPILLTRDIEAARKWIGEKARGTERTGVLASSGGLRLRPDGIHVRAKIDVINWFLNPKDDVRSSYSLEEAATEFDIQGLELDWTIVAWDGDFRYKDREWKCLEFKGTRWQAVKNEERRRFLKNAYRVLLTRARQGMVIFVPRGDPNDPTRLPEFYDGTYEYLIEIGLKPIP